MIGYMNGLAVTILIGQLPKLFGFKVSADGLIGEITGFVKGLANGEAVPAAAAVGIAAIAAILAFRACQPGRCNRQRPRADHHGQAGQPGRRRARGPGGVPVPQPVR
jgi:MFS superfamily sulfate permease-like transporter